MDVRVFWSPDCHVDPETGSPSSGDRIDIVRTVVGVVLELKDAAKTLWPLSDPEWVRVLTAKKNLHLFTSNPLYEKLSRRAYDRGDEIIGRLEGLFDLCEGVQALSDNVKVVVGYDTNRILYGEVRFVVRQ